MGWGCTSVGRGVCLACMMKGSTANCHGCRTSVTPDTSKAEARGSEVEKSRPQLRGGGKGSLAGLRPRGRAEQEERGQFHIQNNYLPLGAGRAPAVASYVSPSSGGPSTSYGWKIEKRAHARTHGHSHTVSIRTPGSAPSAALGGRGRRRAKPRSPLASGRSVRPSPDPPSAPLLLPELLGQPGTARESE